MKRKIVTVKEIIFFLIFVIVSSIGCFLILKGYTQIKYQTGYASSFYRQVTIYNQKFQPITTITRGTIIKYNQIPIKKTAYCQILTNQINYIKCNQVVKNKEKIVQERIIYVRTPVTIYKNPQEASIISQINKGEAIEVIGYDKLNKDGSVNMYKIKYMQYVGYVYGKYLVIDQDIAKLNYDETASYQIHKNRGDSYGGGDAGKLDYYPVKHPHFKKNIMPKEVRSLYINIASLNNIDNYIALAKQSNINAFVIDIKDDTNIAYQANTMQQYTRTTYNNAYYKKEEYKNIIKKLQDNEFYIIGRITVFKDSYYVNDNEDSAIININTNKPYDSGSWASPYNRKVWEYNIKLARESIQLGFNEIQLDYVRFPDQLYNSKNQELFDLKNSYNEEKAEAIQKFLLYAKDEIHKEKAYISVDVFGETAHNYVSSYGQYWPAISNVVDVISPMPYPDHFNEHQYEIDDIVWAQPYELLNIWGTNYVQQRQKEIPTPAKVRTWIQAYDTIKEPYIIYDENKIYDQIRGLYNANLTHGYMTFNATANILKYASIKGAFVKTSGNMSG
ncbi:MAG: putative glycoside hydrolase [Bacilli bacterium]